MINLLDTAQRGGPEMNIAERLETIRQAVPGCALVAFGDLGSKLVLRSSSTVQHPQEYLDQLCAQANHGFYLQDALLEQNTPRGHNAGEVMVVTVQETRIFIRTPDADRTAASDAILCVCDSEQAARDLVAPAKQLLIDLCRGA